MNSLRVLVADDHDIVRKGLCALLGGHVGWEIAAEARDGREAVKMAQECNPHVAVLDIAMPGLNGLEAARQIKKTLPSTKVLVLTMHESDSVIREALDAGASGYVLKTDAGKHLISAVEALQNRGTFFNLKVEQAMRDGYLKVRTKKTTTETASRLTGRQREIVQLLSEGKSSKEAASDLNLSVKTVETHRANIMNRLNLHSIGELVRYAIHNHIIEP